MSLDSCYEILSWPIGELDPFRLSVRMQVWRVVSRIAIESALHGGLDRELARERNRDRPFEVMAREHAALKADATDA